MKGDFLSAYPFAAARRLTVQKNKWEVQKMKLDDRTRKLIAVGASVACNCHPCLDYHLGQAQSMGIEATLIEEAIDAGKAVRAGAASSMDRLASRLTGRKGEALQAACSGAGCSC
jgi:AhpD family alkylhydroperoxidase